MKCQQWDEAGEGGKRRADAVRASPATTDPWGLAELMMQLVQGLAARVPDASPEPEADAAEQPTEVGPDESGPEPTSEGSRALACWMTNREPEPLDVAEVLRQLREIEDGVVAERRPSSRRALPRRRPWARSPSQRPPSSADDADEADIDELLQRTLESYRPAASPPLDEMFTGHSVYEDMRASMSDSLLPVSIPQLDGEAQRAEPAIERPRTSSRKHRLLGVAALCVASFGLGSLVHVTQLDSAGPVLATRSLVPIDPWSDGVDRAQLRARLESTPTSSAAPGSDAGTAPVVGSPPPSSPSSPEGERDHIAEDSRSIPPETNSLERRGLAELPAPSDADAGALQLASPEPPAAALANGAVEDADAGAAEVAVVAPSPFDPQVAMVAVEAAAARAASCGDGEHRGRAVVHITLAPSGRVTSAVLAGRSRLAGTAVGSCIALAMRAVRVPPFEGDRVTVSKTVHVH